MSIGECLLQCGEVPLQPEITTPPLPLVASSLLHVETNSEVREGGNRERKNPRLAAVVSVSQGAMTDTSMVGFGQVLQDCPLRKKPWDSEGSGVSHAKSEGEEGGRVGNLCGLGKLSQGAPLN